MENIHLKCTSVALDTLRLLHKPTKVKKLKPYKFTLSMEMEKSKMGERE